MPITDALNKIALVTGYTGQDGTFLTKLLLDHGYVVIGLCRRISTEPPHRIRGAFDFSDAISSGRLVLVEGDLLSRSSLDRIISQYQPNEIYNLAAQSHVGQSFSQPEFTIEADFIGVVNLIESLIAAKYPGWRFYQASTSEMFGPRNKGTLLDELSGFNPVSPYAIAKTAAHFYCRMRRDQGYFVSCGILFNHESEIRGGDFVTQKIARGAVNWQQTAEPIKLGNLDSVRDWGYAGDYVKAMHAMLQQDNPDDYVIATGEVHSVREFVECALRNLNLDIKWHGSGSSEYGTVNGKVAVQIDPRFYRPNEVGYLYGDCSKARDVIGWFPTVEFYDLVQIMVEAAK